MGGIKYAVGEKDREIGKIVKKKKKVSECVDGEQSEESDSKPRSNYIS